MFLAALVENEIMSDARALETALQPESNEGAEQVPTGENAQSTLVEQSRILIEPGGRVIFENLTPELAEVALLLNPEQQQHLLCMLEDPETSAESSEDDAT